MFKNVSNEEWGRIMELGLAEFNRRQHGTLEPMTGSCAPREEIVAGVPRNGESSSFNASSSGNKRLRDAELETESHGKRTRVEVRAEAGTVHSRNNQSSATIDVSTDDAVNALPPDTRRDILVYFAEQFPPLRNFICQKYNEEMRRKRTAVKDFDRSTCSTISSVLSFSTLASSIGSWRARSCVLYSCGVSSGSGIFCRSGRGYQCPDARTDTRKHFQFCGAKPGIPVVSFGELFRENESKARRSNTSQFRQRHPGRNTENIGPERHFPVLGGQRKIQLHRQ
ncbi:hypothetical protein IWZ00DRAFT_299816 [Phyllosticta capitalensis]